VSLNAKAQATLDNYEANLYIARNLGEAYGFQVLAFWQPALVYGRKVLSEFEMKITANENNEGAFRTMARVYREAERRAATDHSFLFLGGDFDRCSDSVYIDRWMHLTPTGNEIVAHSLASHIEQSLKSSNKP